MRLLSSLSNLVRQRARAHDHKKNQAATNGVAMWFPRPKAHRFHHLCVEILQTGPASAGWVAGVAGRGDVVGGLEAKLARHQPPLLPHIHRRGLQR